MTTTFSEAELIEMRNRMSALEALIRNVDVCYLASEECAYDLMRNDVMAQEVRELRADLKLAMHLCCEDLAAMQKCIRSMR